MSRSVKRGFAILPALVLVAILGITAIGIESLAPHAIPQSQTAAPPPSNPLNAPLTPAEKLLLSLKEDQLLKTNEEKRICIAKKLEAVKYAHEHPDQYGRSATLQQAIEGNTVERNKCIAAVYDPFAQGVKMDEAVGKDPSLQAHNYACIGEKTNVWMDSKGKGSIVSEPGPPFSEVKKCATSFCDVNGKNCVPAGDFEAGTPLLDRALDPGTLSLMTPDQRLAVSYLGQLPPDKQAMILESFDNSLAVADREIKELEEYCNTSSSSCNELISDGSKKTVEQALEEKSQERLALQDARDAIKKRIESLGTPAVLTPPTDKTSIPSLSNSESPRNPDYSSGAATFPPAAEGGAVAEGRAAKVLEEATSPLVTSTAAPVQPTFGDARSNLSRGPATPGFGAPGAYSTAVSQTSAPVDLVAMNEEITTARAQYNTHVRACASVTCSPSSLIQEEAAIKVKEQQFAIAQERAAAPSVSSGGVSTPYKQFGLFGGSTQAAESSASKNSQGFVTPWETRETTARAEVLPSLPSGSVIDDPRRAALARTTTEVGIDDPYASYIQPSPPTPSPTIGAGLGSNPSGSAQQGGSDPTKNIPLTSWGVAPQPQSPQPPRPLADAPYVPPTPIQPPQTRPVMETPSLLTTSERPNTGAPSPLAPNPTSPAIKSPQESLNPWLSMAKPGVPLGTLAVTQPTKQNLEETSLLSSLGDRPIPPAPSALTTQPDRPVVETSSLSGGTPKLPAGAYPPESLNPWESMAKPGVPLTTLAVTQSPKPELSETPLSSSIGKRPVAPTTILGPDLPGPPIGQAQSVLPTGSLQGISQPPSRTITTLPVPPAKPTQVVLSPQPAPSALSCGGVSVVNCLKDNNLSYDYGSRKALYGEIFRRDSEYGGTEPENDKLLNYLKTYGYPTPEAIAPNAHFAKAASYKGDSIVDFLTAAGESNSKAARSVLAQMYLGIDDYSGTTQQNQQLLAALRREIGQ